MFEFWQGDPQQSLSEAAPLSCPLCGCSANSKCTWKAQPESMCCCYCTCENWIHCKGERLMGKETHFQVCPTLLLLEAETFTWVESSAGGVAGSLKTILLINSQIWGCDFMSQALPGLAEVNAGWAQVKFQLHLLLRHMKFAPCFVASKIYGKPLVIQSNFCCSQGTLNISD